MDKCVVAGVVVIGIHLKLKGLHLDVVCSGRGGGG